MLYSIENVPPPENPFRQVEETFVRLHPQQNLYETRRIGICGISSAAMGLTPEIVPYLGDMQLIKVK